MRGLMRDLSDKQKRFVEEYLVDLNATQSAIRAGYSAKTARQIAAENLTKPNIQAAIEKAVAERAERLEVTQDWVIKNLVDNVERAMQAVEVLDREGNGTGEYRYEGNVANRALELVGKHLGMFKERYEHSFAQEAEIIIGGFNPGTANGQAGSSPGATNGSHLNGSL